jgi:hypothetical protein
VTPHPTASWTAQQIVECCAWERVLARFLVHDRDSCYGTTFDRRVRNIGIAQVRTPLRSPRANAIAERWVRSVRTECLDHVLIFNERHLQKVLAEYVGYFNDWRPHRSMGQRAPCAPQHLRLIEALKLERSSRQLCSEAFITFISKPHDDVPDLILAPYRPVESGDKASRPTALHPFRGPNPMSSAILRHRIEGVEPWKIH